MTMVIGTFKKNAAGKYISELQINVHGRKGVRQEFF
jgi:hypothetical protein